MTKKQDNTENIEAEKQKTLATKRSKKEAGSKSAKQNDSKVDEAGPKTNDQVDGEPEVIDVSKEDIIEVERHTQDQKQNIYSQKPASNRTQFGVLIAGGIFAVAIGFGAAIGLYQYGVLITPTLPNEAQIDIGASISKQNEQFSELEKRVSSVQSKLELLISRAGAGNTSEKIDLLGEEFNQFATELETVNLQLAKLSKRTDDLENRPVLQAVPEDIIEKHSKELETLQATLTQQREQVQAVMQEAEAKEAIAKKAALEARIFSAASRLSTAVKNGSNYADALVDFEAASELKVPDVLRKYAQTGFVTKEQLIEQFPIAARLAVNSARSEGQDAQGKTFADYLKTQLKARSVVPREGMSADAILSRAEAAVKDDRLTDALSELEALDLTARNQMNDWVSQAEERLAAVAYIETIVAQIGK